jgi:hypothetical protein
MKNSKKEIWLDANKKPAKYSGNPNSHKSPGSTRDGLSGQDKRAAGKYRFATIRENYEDYSSGRVFYGAPGATGFPIRLVSEIFQRCVARLREKGVPPRYTLYDPCCGGGYSAAVTGYLHGGQISKIYASDISSEAIELARRNLSLLQPEGLNQRIREIRSLIKEFNKQSHLDALESSLHLKRQLESLERPIRIECFQFDILGNRDVSQEIEKVHLVMTDVPYGRVTNWHGLTDNADPTQRLLTNIRAVLTPSSVVAITTTQKRAAHYAGFHRLEEMKIGKRRILIFEMTEPRV